MKSIKTIFASVLVLAATASCTKDFEKINTNPNRVTMGQISASNCIEPILYGIPRFGQNHSWYYCHEVSGMTACTSSGTRQEHRYNINSSQYQGIWDNYARYGYDAYHMSSLAQKEKDDFLNAVGIFIKAYCLGCLTSLYGDIPYTEAYMGSVNLAPAFESQEAVYKHVIDDIDAAVAILSTKPKMQKSELDALYGGSSAKWIKFANSVRMRTLLYLASIDESWWSEIQAMVDDPVKYPVFESNADNATLYTQDIDPYKSYFGNGTPIAKSDFQLRRFTELAISMLVRTDDKFFAIDKDPRLSVWAQNNKTDQWQGTVGGASTDECQEAEKRTLAYQNYQTMCRPDQPMEMMDYSEILFIEAEGVLKGKLTVGGKTAKELYEAAVRADIEKWAPMVKYNDRPKEIKPADIDAYLASPLASWDIAEANTAAGLELDALERELYNLVKGTSRDNAEIAVKRAEVKAKKAALNGRYRSTEDLLLSQKWLSLFYVDYQQFNEWRRTEYPRLVIGNGTVYNEYEYPTRMAYPQYTVSTNFTNVSSALNRMGGKDDMHTTLDWSYAKKNGGHRDPYMRHNAFGD